MPKYCCFLCPSKDFTEKSKSDLCPTCGKPYGFPLTESPTLIGSYSIIEAIDRGFYSVAYKAQSGRLGNIKVLKVSPKAVYSFHNKDFAQECEFHRKLAEETMHVVHIDDYQEHSIEFPGVGLIDCHVAIMDYVSGPTLEQFLAQPRGSYGTYTVAQVALDLLRLWDELHFQHRSHNDLHANNIVVHTIREDARRASELDGNVRAIAVDLGSAADQSKSDSEGMRLGDQHWLAAHLFSLAEWLRLDPDNTSDLDYRVASVLEEKARILASNIKEQRLPTVEETIEDIEAAIQHAFSPWKAPLTLKRFGDSYNALTLSPWFIPFLLVDPDGAWLRKISTRGPQVITGMRGCGKTMLLRALQFHARATLRDGETKDSLLKRIEQDGYVGLFISCNRLLESPREKTKQIRAPFERLLVAYCLETLNAVRHLQEVDGPSVNPLCFRKLANSVTSLLTNVQQQDVKGEHELERYLRKLILELQRGDSQCELRFSPAETFSNLAESIRSCSTHWRGATILYLLDDVTTRYIEEDMAKDIFSRLLFQSDLCAFKLTTESQMLDLGLFSPGGIEQARTGRDYELFDLGAEVYERTGGTGGREFIDEILAQRARYYNNHPKLRPSALLGDEPLNGIAGRIAAAAESSPAKKSVYHGISALSAVCVGDIGDVIHIYEQILRKAQGSKYPPIQATVQTDAYLELCSRRLYELNRRKPALKDAALQFAEASHRLLVDSARKSTSGPIRLRQYAKIYVRITAGDRDAQFARIRELIDCGAFVYSGGSPRTKTRDGDPLHQFKLTFRRLLGLSNFIGLSERDRFELSGEQLEEWLLNPTRSAAILLRNLGVDNDDDDDTIVLSEVEIDKVDEASEETQIPLFAIHNILEGEPSTDSNRRYHEKPKVSAKSVMLEDIQRLDLQTVVLGLGFEDRAEHSAALLFQHLTPEHVLAIGYDDAGKGAAILNAARKAARTVKQVDYRTAYTGDFLVGDGNILVDVSGLAKPVIFKAVRQALRSNRKVWVSHTRAKTYYPTDFDINRVIAAEAAANSYDLLEALSEIFTGEEGPYLLKTLLSTESDESRRRVLIAFASAKHERLMSILEQREYDGVELVVPSSPTSRTRVATIAAEIAASRSSFSRIMAIDTDDISNGLDALVDRYQYWFLDGGTNVEIGLTGSKMQTVAAAAMSAVYKLSQVWYVSPTVFNVEKFTTGAEETNFYELSIVGRAI